MTLSQMRLLQRGPEDRKGSFRIAHHQRGIHADDAIAKPMQLLIPARVSAAHRTTTLGAGAANLAGEELGGGVEHD